MTKELTARNFWLANRVRDCVDTLNQLEVSEGWDEYREKAKTLAQELLYAVVEWEKYYK